MAYVINRTNGSQLVVLEDGTVNTSTSVGLVGRNYTGYGEIQNENFVGLLENWSNNNPPARPLSGQTWFNALNKTLNVYNGVAWSPVGSAIIQNSAPEGFPGTLWFKTTTSQLFVYNNDSWNLVGPEGAEGFGVTKIRSRQVLDNFGSQKIILEVLVDDDVTAVISKTAFQLDESTPIVGFGQISAGLTISSTRAFAGTLNGNASSATRLVTPRTINGIAFDGQNDINVTAPTTGTLSRGSYLTGANFNGATSTTWQVDASPSNLIGKVVARDSAGNFEATTITADLIGNVTGNVTATEGSSSFNVVQANQFVGATLSGNAQTATRLKTPRTINGVEFDGTADITITTSADTLTGTQLAANIVTLGILTNLSTTDQGITVGSQIRLFLESGSVPTLRCSAPNKNLNIEVTDSTQSGGYTHVGLMPSDVALSLGGNNNPAFAPGDNNVTDLGLTTKKWKTVYAGTFDGTATAAQYADLAENYLADADYNSGTVLEFGGKFEITLAEDETRRVAGIVSSNPAHLMNSGLQGDHVVALALQGRVPCKVRGKIRKGDMLVSGGNGYARPTHDPKIGTIVGKALEDFDGSDGVIEVVVGRI
jgi:hypothetical protein